MLSSGAFFAGYRIERHLGSGGMGTVYLARNPDLPRSEALKVLSAELSRDPDFRARFIAEADVAATLDHPNIVSVHRRGQFDDQLWIAMQYVHGPNADDARRAAAMPPARAVYVIGEVAKALDYAHRRGVIHRDVKPANFLLAESPGSDERVLLGDFGIARALGQTGLTAAGSVMARVAYAAPEVLAGQRFDRRADVYSLGCSLFRLLTGQIPFGGDGGLPAVTSAHLHQPPPTVSDRVAGVPAAMDTVIATAMAKNPDHRYGSARDLAHAATAALYGSGPAAATAPHAALSGPPILQYWQPPTEFAARPSPRAPRRRRTYTLTAAATAIVAATATAVIVTTHSDNEAGPPASASPTTTPTAAIVPGSAMRTLLLDLPQMADIVGDPGLTVSDTRGAFDDQTVFMDDPDKDCAGAFDVAQQTVFSQAGSIGVQDQNLNGEGYLTIASQAVIGLSNPQVAQQLVTDQITRWSACSSRTITIRSTDQPPKESHWTFGPTTNTDGTLTITYSLDGAENTGCQHAMAARKNVVIDTETCRPNVNHQAVDILTAIAAKIAQ